MKPLSTLEACLAQAMADIVPVPPERLRLAEAFGHMLATDLALPFDLPVRSQALHAGVAVASLDTIGASPHLPLPVAAALRVFPGQDLPPGTDAVLPEYGIDWSGPSPLAIHPISPGEGMRRAGHDGRAGQVIARAGNRLRPLAALLAAEAGIETAEMRRPRVKIALENPAHAAFAARWAMGHGATLSSEAPQLVLRTGTDHAPRLALATAETAWLHVHNDSLILDLPSRFDGMIAGLLGLGVPSLGALTGATRRPLMRPLLRKAASAPGMSELLLLTARSDGWHPAAPGLITLAALADAHAYAILPPDSEGLPAGALLAGHPLDFELCATP